MASSLSRLLGRILKNEIINEIPLVRKHIIKFSTGTPKYFDVLETFIDILRFNRSQAYNQTSAVSSHNNVINKRVKLNKLIQKINTIDASSSADLLKSELESNIIHENWENVATIIQVFVNRKISLEDSKIVSLAQIFSSIGFKEGLNLLRSLCEIVKSDLYFQKGEFLHYLAKCNWINGNVKECLQKLREVLEKYPSLKEDIKILLISIISEAVSSRSEAELLNVVEFVQIFTRKSEDLYPLSFLWYHLFLSDWFTDQKLADTLVDTHEELQLCITLMSTSLTRYLIQNNKINDVYRLFQIFLKHEMKDSYAIVNQILFDYYCLKRDRSACAEIIKSSVTLNISLREEQYNQFITWSVSGDPYKLINKNELEKIYSKF